MKYFSAICLGLVFTTLSFAAESNIAADMEAMKAQCEAESKTALYPEEYVEQCLDDMLQALKEEGVNNPVQVDPAIEKERT